jgi:hypothetical protein
MCEERIKNLESIDFYWVTEAASKQQTWDEMFEELKLFKAKYGHIDVSKTDADNPKLGKWVSNQRQGYRNYKAGNKQKREGMCEERINKLESIDFKWVSEHASKQQTWDEMFEELKLFKAKHGHANVPQSHADNPKLGQWVSKQRSGYRNYKAGNKQNNNGMCEERITQLESIGFEWVSEAASKKQTWNEMFEELKVFKAKHGHSNVPTRHADNSKLGYWVDRQRTGYRNYKAGNKQKSYGMCEEKKTKLESIDFNWGRYRT